MSNSKTVAKATMKKENVQTLKNGATPKSSTKPEKLDMFQEAKKGSNAEAVKNELKEQTKHLIENFRPTAEDRIKNAEKFKILTAKYEHLKAKKEELEKFKISSDGTKERIYFENSEGFKLEVSNSNIVEEMINLAELTLNNILINTQSEVQTFVI